MSVRESSSPELAQRLSARPLGVRLRRGLLWLGIASITASPALAHPGSGGQREIVFPDVADRQTLVVDLHTHSVFSDGSVWPTVRVEEALKDGLDAVAITEHLEYQPHSDDIPHPDRNRAYELALEAASGTGLLVVPGSEITRDMPPGHSNAVFIENANALLRDDPVAVFRAAQRQGGFTFWNHPHWVGQRSDGVARLEDLHRRLIEDGLIHGIEVTNDLTYSDEALAIAIEHGLTIIGTSDVHGLVDWRYAIPQGGHRPVTLVFATDKSLEALEEALRAGRTVAWMGDLLVGLEPHLAPLLDASLEVVEASYGRGELLDLTVQNHSSARIVARREGGLGLHSGGPTIVFEPHSRTSLQLSTGSRVSTGKLQLEILSALVAPRTHPSVDLEFSVP